MKKNDCSSIFSRPGKFNSMRGLRTIARGAILAVLTAQPLAAQETFYYKKGKKVPLEVDKSKTYALFTSETTKTTVENAAKSAKATLRKFAGLKAPENIRRAPLPSPPPPPPKWAIIDNNDMTAQPLNQAELAGKVEYKAPFFLTEGKKQVGISHLIFVKLKEAGDLSALEKKAKELKVAVLGNNKEMPLWYTLSCGKESAGNALEVANKIFETNQFAAAEPDFLADFQIEDPSSACTDDNLFSMQWGLNNTTQSGGASGLDIGVCAAWGASTGKGVVVAVVDHGVELNHPDLAPHVSGKSFDTEDAKSPSKLRGRHGTACAGIIGAIRGNGKLGVAGVAPDSVIMSISDKLTAEPGAQQKLATGISWAWRNGAQVISNSWGRNELASPLIDDAIEDALSKGRGGKGCIVVFAAGNSDGPVIYPANSNPAILTVGAMSPCGQRKSSTSCDGESWGSCFGAELDVMAPGVLIPTTDIVGPSGYDSGDFHLTFNGTSAATPHAAGVAALILEVRPNLTGAQVVGIIEQTARKEGPYAYQTVAGRASGTWNKEAGYGLVDAKACVEAAKQLPDSAGE